MTVLGFAWPLLLLALPLPLVLRLVTPTLDAGPALRMPHLPDGATPATAARAPLSLPHFLASLAWLLLVIAAARPQMPSAAPPPAVSGRDMMLAFDVSMSMSTADMLHDGKAVDRLQAAKLLAGDFLERRHGDRVGLIVFGAQAYLHTPLTFDLAAVRAALATTEPGLAGRETALGDAIALAAKHLRAVPGSKRVLVLLTDGANTAGTLSPERAIWLAQRENVRIHVIGIGAASRGDDALLHAIGTRTGGTYQRVADSGGFARFLGEIDRLEPVEGIDREPPPMRELYSWPLGMALVLVVALALHRTREPSA